MLCVVQDSPCEAVIQRDVNRTFPAHDFFKESGGLGQDSLYRISKVTLASLCGHDVALDMGHSASVVFLTIVSFPTKENVDRSFFGGGVEGWDWGDETYLSKQ